MAESNVKISRRNLLKGLGAGAFAGFMVGAPRRAQAQISGSAADTIAFYRYQVGDLMLTAIKDGVSPLGTDILATNVEAEEVQAVLTANNLPTDQLLNTFNVLMVQAGEETYLVDTGLGPGNGGKLIATMEMMGMAPGDVTGVIGTHWHPDHVGGLSTDGSANFPNATYYLSQTEYDFVQANAEQFTGGAAAAIAPYADNDQLTLYSDGDEIVPGVQAVAAPGHTPGHTALMMSSNGDQLMHVVDAAINAIVHVQNPSFAIQFDADAEQASATRTSLLSRAADEQIPVMGYHFPFPGIGYIARTDDAFRFVPYN